MTNRQTYRQTDRETERTMGMSKEKVIEGGDNTETEINIFVNSANPTVRAFY